MSEVQKKSSYFGEAPIAAIEIGDGSVRGVLFETPKTLDTSLEVRFAEIEILACSVSNMPFGTGFEVKSKAVKKVLKSLKNVSGVEFFELALTSNLDEALVRSLVDELSFEVITHIPSAFAAAFSICTQTEVSKGVYSLHIGENETTLVKISDGEMQKFLSVQFGSADVALSIERGLGVNGGTAKALFNRYKRLTQTERLSRTVFPIDQIDEGISECTSWIEVGKLTQRSAEKICIAMQQNMNQASLATKSASLVTTGEVAAFYCFHEIAAEILQTTVRQDQGHQNDTLPGFFNAITGAASLGLANYVCILADEGQR